MAESINDPAAAAAAAMATVPAQEINVDLTKLNALSPEVISKQATVSTDSHEVSCELTQTLSDQHRCVAATHMDLNSNLCGLMLISLPQVPLDTSHTANHPPSEPFQAFKPSASKTS